MKAQFKYSFLTGFYTRGIVFAVIFVMNSVFITLGALGWLPLAGKITAVALGGVAIAVMFVFNIISDVSIFRRMFSAPEGYLYALTPAPRWKIMLASVISVAVMDIVTMTIVIFSEVWLSFILAGNDIWNMVWTTITINFNESLHLLWLIPLFISGYLLLMISILFFMTAEKSIFFKLPASGLLTFLLGCACWYVISLLQLVLIPFGYVERWRIFITITLTHGAAVPVYILLTLLEAAGLFILTSKLMEKRMNI